MQAPIVTALTPSSTPVVNPEIRVIDDLDSLRRFLSESNLPTIVKIGSERCRPCRTVDEYLPELAKKYAGRVNFIKVDSGSAHCIVRHFGTQFIPDFKFFAAHSDVAISGNRMLDKPNSDRTHFERLIEDHFLATFAPVKERGTSVVEELHRAPARPPNKRARTFFNLAGV